MHSLCIGRVEEHGVVCKVPDNVKEKKNHKIHSIDTWTKSPYILHKTFVQENVNSFDYSVFVVWKDKEKS
jgi:hypothetical protein